MSKHRAITGFGPTAILTTGKSAWQRFGPCTAKQVGIQALFSATSAGQSVKLEAMLTTLSTLATRFRTIASIKSSQFGIVMGTSSAPLAVVRANSTKIKAGANVTLIFAAVN